MNRILSNPIELHKQYDWIPDNSNFHIMHFYDSRINMWVYSGHRCSKCDSVFKSMKAIETHLDACLYIKGERRKGYRGKPKLKSDQPIAILDRYGNEWKPLDLNINQNMSDK